MWFLLIFWLGLGNPRHIATKSPFCMVVTKSQLWPKICFRAPLLYFSVICRTSCQLCFSAVENLQLLSQVWKAGTVKSTCDPQSLFSVRAVASIDSRKYQNCEKFKLPWFYFYSGSDRHHHYHHLHHRLHHVHHLATGKMNDLLACAVVSYPLSPHCTATGQLNALPEQIRTN